MFKVTLKLSLLSIVIVAVIFLVAPMARAALLSDPRNETNGAWMFLDWVATSGGYTTSLDADYSVNIAYLIRIVLSFIGILFICLAIYAGIMWVNARGNEDAVKEAKDIIINASIGLAVVITAYSLAYYFIAYLTIIEQADSYPSQELQQDLKNVGKTNEEILMDPTQQYELIPGY